MKASLLSYNELKRQLDYNPLTGIFVYKISHLMSRTEVGDIAGTKDQDGYIVITINKKQYKAHRLAWFHYYGYMPENDIDHKNRIKHNNWILNLRETTKQCNARNIGNYSTNTSGIKGIYKTKNKNTWYVQICVNSKRNHL